MIGIQENVLNWFLIGHFMILISVAILAILFSLVLFLKYNQGMILETIYYCSFVSSSLTTHPPLTFLWSQMKEMAKIRFFNSGAMALFLPRLKDINNFVLKLICSSFNLFLSVRLSVYDCHKFLESL